jgi:hypothetical protein
VPGATPVELKPRIRQPHIDVTQIDGGCWIYGGRHWLEKVLADLGQANISPRKP